LWCDPADRLGHFLHHGTAADNSVLVVLGGQDGGHTHEAARFDRSFNDRTESIEANRLYEVIKSPVLHGFDGRLRGAAWRDDEDDWLLQATLADLLKNLKARTVRQLQIQHNEVGIVLTKAGQSFGCGGCRQDFDAGVFEYTAKRVEHAGLIINDQQTGHGRPLRLVGAVEHTAALHPQAGWLPQ